MIIKKKFLFVFLFVAIFLLTISSSARVDPTYAIVNCKIIPVSGAPFDNGVIIIRNGLIESLGPQERIAIPENRSCFNYLKQGVSTVIAGQCGSSSYISF